MSAGYSASAAGGDARSRELINTVSNISNQLMNEVGKVIIGKQENLRRVTVGILSNGNMLLEDFPGLGKTMLSNTFAKALGCKFKRVQFTPDLLPSDIMGTYMYDQKSGEFKLRAGPLFTNILLADEINRAPPKTQAALLEAMEEKQVTIEGITHKLPAPFVVLATQNPIEQEGTYPLPEAQLDRFLFQVNMGYPELDAEEEIARSIKDKQNQNIRSVFDTEQLISAQFLAQRTPIADHLVKMAVKLVRNSRPQDSNAPEYIRELVNWGAGPRASKYIVAAAKARAILDGRCSVAEDDVREVAPDVLCHRIVVNYHAEAQSISTTDLVLRLLKEMT